MDKQDLWLQILTKIKTRTSNPDFITWFKNTAILDVKENIMTVGVPIPIAARWLKDRFYQQIFESGQEVIPTIEKIAFELDTALVSTEDPRHISSDIFTNDSSKIKTRKRPRIAEFTTEDGLTSKILDKKYTLGNFVIGPSNRLAHAACTAISVEPGKRYNPLFIYGSVGLGKTHLLQATGNAIQKRNPECLVIYVTAETFGNDYVSAIRSRKIEQFNNRYRKVDALIIDDIQFFAGKDGIQEAFFHVFNTLYDSSKQVILSSDRPPKELNNLDARLTSRFEMGMVADVQSPNFETRLAILQEKAKEHQVIIENNILEFIATNVEGSVRQLEGVLMQAIAEAELEHSTPTIKSVERVLRKLDPSRILVGNNETDAIQKARSHEDVVSVVSEYYSIPVHEIVGNKRNQDIVFPRQVAMYLIKTEFRHSLDHIGQTFGGRNHTTVLHAINTIKDRLARDRSFSRDLNALKKELGCS